MKAEVKLAPNLDMMGPDNISFMYSQTVVLVLHESMLRRNGKRGV